LCGYQAGLWRSGSAIPGLSIPCSGSRASWMASATARCAGLSMLNRSSVAGSSKPPPGTGSTIAVGGGVVRLAFCGARYVTSRCGTAVQQRRLDDGRADQIRVVGGGRIEDEINRVRVRGVGRVGAGVDRQRRSVGPVTPASCRDPAAHLRPGLARHVFKLAALFEYRRQFVDIRRHRPGDAVCRGATRPFCSSPRRPHEASPIRQAWRRSEQRSRACAPHEAANCVRF
jgi:hypothetical protein